MLTNERVLVSEKKIEITNMSFHTMLNGSYKDLHQTKTEYIRE